MKYIRTKDGVYEVEDEIFAPATLDLPTEYLYKTIGSNKLINQNDVIHQADTIEELCDEFVAEELFAETNYIAHSNKIVSVEKNLEHFVNYFIEKNKITKDKLLNVYGAIWTSKGLIYVAKLNDKGELELI